MSVLSALVITIVMVTGCSGNEERIDTFAASCNYLENSEGRPNAYIWRNRTCCMCHKGTEWADDCDSSLPSSTLCRTCRWSDDNVDDRSYMNYEPHRQKQCFPVTLKNCPPPKIYKEGSVTEAPACVCPPGTIKQGKRRCIKAPVTETTSKPSEVNTRTTDRQTTFIPPNPTTPVSIRTSSEASNTIPKSTTSDVDVTSQPLTHDSTETTTATTRENLKKPTKKQPNLTLPIALGCSFGALALIIIIILIIVYIKRKRARANAQRKIPNDSSSRSALLHNGTPDMEVRRNVSHGNGSQEINESSQSLAEASPQTPDTAVRRNVPQGNDFQVISETPQAQAKASPESRPANNRVDMEHSSNEDSRQTEQLLSPGSNELFQQRQQRQHAEQNVLPSVQYSHASPQPSQGTNNEARVQIGRSLTDTERVQRNRDIVRMVGDKWGVKLPNKEALRIFRHILSEEDCEYKLEDARRDHGNDNYEFYHQLMKLAIETLGHKLTPELLMEKLSGLNPPLQTAIDIVNSCQNFFNTQATGIA